MNSTLNIIDGSGFIAVVNPNKYLSFVDENWEFPQLLNHFVEEMNKQSLIIWSTGLQNTWTVLFSNTPSDQKAFREISKSIIVTDEHLFLTNYEDLSMAAQFPEEKIPSSHNSILAIKLNNGNYIFSIRQMFDPTNYSHDQSDKPDFEIIIQASNNDDLIKAETVFWWNE
jgi:hypothetical protein